MMRKVMFLVVMLAMMLATGAISAQDINGTSVPATNTRSTAVTSVPSANSGGVEEMTSPPAPLQEERGESTAGDVERVALNVGQIVAGIIAAFVAGGWTVGAALLVLFDRLKNDKVLLAAMEGLTNSFPKETRDLLNQVGKTAREVGTLVEGVTDGKEGVTTIPVG